MHPSPGLGEGAARQSDHRQAPQRGHEAPPQDRPGPRQGHFSHNTDGHRPRGVESSTSTRNPHGTRPTSGSGSTTSTPAGRHSPAPIAAEHLGTNAIHEIQTEDHQDNGGARHRRLPDVRDCPVTRDIQNWYEQTTTSSPPAWTTGGEMSSSPATHINPSTTHTIQPYPSPFMPPEDFPAEVHILHALPNPTLIGRTQAGLVLHWPRHTPTDHQPQQEYTTSTPLNPYNTVHQSPADTAPPETDGPVSPKYRTVTNIQHKRWQPLKPFSTHTGRTTSFLSPRTRRRLEDEDKAELEVLRTNHRRRKDAITYMAQHGTREQITKALESPTLVTVWRQELLASLTRFQHRLDLGTTEHTKTMISQYQDMISECQDMSSDTVAAPNTIPPTTTTSSKTPNPPNTQPHTHRSTPQHSNKRQRKTTNATANSSGPLADDPDPLGFFQHQPATSTTELRVTKDPLGLFTRRSRSISSTTKLFSRSTSPQQHPNQSRTSHRTAIGLADIHTNTPNTHSNLHHQHHKRGKRPR